MTDVVDLLKRLREVVSTPPDSNGLATNWYRNPEGPKAVDLIEALTAENEQLRDKLARARDALEDVVYPLNALQRQADEDGASLSGAAYSIANDLGFVQNIARQALKDTVHD